MAFISSNQGRIDITFHEGEKDGFSGELQIENLDGTSSPWDETVRPTALAQVRKDFNPASLLLLPMPATVRTPTLDGVPTLTVDFEFDLAANPINLAAAGVKDFSRSIVRVGWWDYLLTFDDGRILRPGYGIVSLILGISRA